VKPAAVQVLFAVEEETNHEAVLGLGPDAFQIYEDNVLVSSPDALKVINPDLTATQSTLLLLDWSGNAAGTPDAAAMLDATNAFVAKVRPQKVAVYAFDGTPELHPVAPFGASEAQLKSGLDALKDWKPKDDTSNLNGATAAALKTLRGATGDLIAGGALVIVSRQPDRAGRVSQKDLDEVLQKPENSKIRRFSVSLSQAGQPVAKSSEGGFFEGEGFHRRGANAAQPAVRSTATTADLPAKLEELGGRVAGFGKGYYFLVVCSGARAGQHEVRVEVTRKLTDAKGHTSVQNGTLTHKFSADGFGPGCKPTVPPEFTTAPEQLKTETKPEPKPEAKPKPAAKPPAAAPPAAPPPPASSSPEMFQP
jgi:hypothetical protein